MKSKLLRKLTVLSLLMAISMGLCLSGAIAAQPKYKFIQLGNVVADPFWVPVRKGMEHAAKLLNVDATFTGPEEWNIRRQREMLDTIVDTDVDGIAVFIPEPGTLDAPMKAALARGIPVIAFNNDQPDAPRMAFIGQGEYEAGQMMGRSIVKLIPRGSKIMIGIHNPGQTALELRKDGVISITKDYDMQVDVKFTPLMKPAEIMTTLESYYAVNTDVKAFLAVSPVVGNLMAKFTVERGIEDEVVVGSFDLLPRLLDYIREGTVAFTIDQQPFLQGFQTMVLLYLYKEFALYPTNIQTGGALIDKNNVEIVAQLVEKGYR